MSDHEHEWTYRADAIPSESWGCAECDATSDTCGTCNGPSGSSLLICDRCLRREQRVLDDVERYLEQWDTRDAVRKKSPAAFALVPVHGGGGSRRGPEDVLSPLYGWAGRWAEIVGASNETVADFLKGHLMWAAHNAATSGWEDYRRSARRVRAAARGLVGLAPERLVERCIYCNGTVVQDRSDTECRAYDDGLQDEARCTGCGLTWESREHFQIAVRHHIWQLPETSPDALVTLEQARRIFPDVSRNTLNQIIKRDRDRHQKSLKRIQKWEVEQDGERPEEYALRLPSRGLSGDGKPVYLIRDIHATVSPKGQMTAV